MYLNLDLLQNIYKFKRLKWYSFGIFQRLVYCEFTRKGCIIDTNRKVSDLLNFKTNKKLYIGDGYISDVSEYIKKLFNNKEHILDKHDKCISMWRVEKFLYNENYSFQDYSDSYKDNDWLSDFSPNPRPGIYMFNLM